MKKLNENVRLLKDYHLVNLEEQLLNQTVHTGKDQRTSFFQWEGMRIQVDYPWRREVVYH